MIVLVIYAARLPIFVVQELQEADDEFFVDRAERNYFALVANEAANARAHHPAGGHFALGDVFLGDTFTVVDKVDLLCLVVVLEAIFAVLDVDKHLRLDSLCHAHLLLVPFLVDGLVLSLLRTQVNAQETVLSLTVDVAVQIDGLIAVCQLFCPDSYRLLHKDFFLLSH